MAAGHAGEGGIDFGEAVSTAAAGGRVEFQKAVEAGLVMKVVAIEDRHED
jgi:hypothetical protein